MHIVFCYITRTVLPEYIYLSLKQFRLFNPNISTFFITNANLPMKFNNLNLKIIKPKDLILTKKHIEFQKKNIMKHTSENKGLPKGFWTLSAERFFWIEELMIKEKLENVIQIECDNLAYYDFNIIFKKISNIYVNHLVCGDRENHALSNAICYFKNTDSISKYTIFLREKLDKPYNIILNEFNKMGIPGRIRAQVNDMCITLLYFRYNKNKVINNYKIIDIFPLLPFNNKINNDDESNRNFDKFGVIFDGAHWGMHIGGWPKIIVGSDKSRGPGHKDPQYYVGKLLISGRLIFKWGKDNRGRKIPLAYDTKNKTETRIINLHIHCKEVEKFIS